MPGISHKKAQKAHKRGRVRFCVCALLWQLLASEHSHALKLETSSLLDHQRAIVLTQ